MKNQIQRLIGKGLVVAAALIVLTQFGCNKSDNTYFGVSPKLTAYGVVKAGSWYKFRDSLGTKKDCVAVIKLSNTFNPIAGEAEENLYQTIIVELKHFPSLDTSRIVMVRNRDTSIFKYTNTLKKETTILTEPLKAGIITTRLESLKSGKYLFTDILVVSEANKPDSMLYIARGKWMVKKIYSSTPQQKWILDTLVIR